MPSIAFGQRALVALLFALVLSPTVAPAQSGPEPVDLVRGFYAPEYRNDEMPLSPRLGALLDAAIANSHKHDAPVTGLDFAWQLNAQDSEPGFEKTLKIAQTARSADSATVRASFYNGREEELDYLLLRQNGRWVVDDILYLKGEATSLSDMLKTGASETP